MKKLKLRKEVKKTIIDLLMISNLIVCLLTSNTLIGIITLINAIYFNIKSIQIDDKII